MTGKPRVLLVDDEPSSALLPDTVESVLLDPESEQFGAELATELSNVDLVLLDHNLHLPQELSIQARDGASFVGLLRSWARGSEPPLPPVAIYTSEYEAFADEIPAVGPAVPLGGGFIGREARVAPTLDVEWLIAKGRDDSLAHIEALAHACLSLRTIMGNDKASLAEIERFVGPPKEVDWAEIASAQLLNARPPISEPGGQSHGARGATPVLRWLLQRALPYPGLFISDLYAAWALGIDPGSLAALEKNMERDWVRDLFAARYSGPGERLFPRKWWAAGIDLVAWRLRNRAHDLDSLQIALDELGGPGLVLLEDTDQVVVLDIDLEEVGLARLDEAAQIHPPGWPAEAVEPWMRLDVIASEPLAQAMIDSSDSGSKAS